MNQEFWDAIERLMADSKVVIDRPRGSCHPRYSNMVYPLDYGYLENSASMDGNGIDVWRRTAEPQQIDALICTVDLFKRDSEIKILLGCTAEEKETVLAFHNDSAYMKGILIERDSR